MTRLVNPIPRVCVVNILFQVAETEDDETYKRIIERGISFAADITKDVRQMTVAVLPGRPEQYAIPSDPTPPPRRL